MRVGDARARDESVREAAYGRKIVVFCRSASDEPGADPGDNGLMTNALPVEIKCFAAIHRPEAVGGRAR